MEFYDHIRYCIHVNGSIRRFPFVGFTCGNKLTLTDAKKAISEAFERNPSYDYAEIYDRDTNETIYRTRWSGEYRKVKEGA